MTTSPNIATFNTLSLLNNGDREQRLATPEKQGPTMLIDLLCGGSRGCSPVVSDRGSPTFLSFKQGRSFWQQETAESAKNNQIANPQAFESTKLADPLTKVETVAGSVA